MCNQYIQRQLDDLRSLNQIKDEVMKEIKMKEDAVKNFMVESGIDELVGNNKEIVTYKRIISNKFDTSSFKTQFKDLYQSFIRQSTSYRFHISY